LRFSLLKKPPTSGQTLFIDGGLTLYADFRSGSSCGQDAPNVVTNKYPDFNWRKTMADLIVVGYEDEFKAEEVRLT